MGQLVPRFSGNDSPKQRELIAKSAIKPAAHRPSGGLPRSFVVALVLCNGLGARSRHLETSHALDVVLRTAPLVNYMCVLWGYRQLAKLALSVSSGATEAGCSFLFVEGSVSSGATVGILWGYRVLNFGVDFQIIFGRLLARVFVLADDPFAREFLLHREGATHPTANEAESLKFPESLVRLAGACFEQSCGIAHAERNVAVIAAVISVAEFDQEAARQR